MQSDAGSTVCRFSSHFTLDKRNDANTGRQQAVPEPWQESCKTARGKTGDTPNHHKKPVDT